MNSLLVLAIRLAAPVQPRSPEVSEGILTDFSDFTTVIGYHVAANGNRISGPHWSAWIISE